MGHGAAEGDAASQALLTSRARGGIHEAWQSLGTAGDGSGSPSPLFFIAR